jgi:beta-glucosidase-like glycosyl hydrolase
MTTPFSDAADRVRGGADPRAEAAQLVAAMTVEERLSCLDGDAPFWPGLLDMAGGGYYTHPWPAARVDRLGVPGIAFADGPRGCVIGDATAFPVSMARGATFDPDLERRIGRAIGAELRASGATFTGAVCMNLLRHPAWGRAQETYGEDPLHVGAMAVAFTEGLQEHVMACMKHFALNSMENARFTVDVAVDERALHEVYLPHFRRVAAAGVASVMSAYNSVNGQWCGEHPTLLTDVLRDEWGFDGFVISDFIFGLRDPVASVRAGLDIEMPFRQQRAMSLGDALASGALDQADVDRGVEWIVATLLRFADRIDRPQPYEVVGSAAHRALAREAAVASTVLLTNRDRLLPVAAETVRRIAVLGRLAALPNLGDGGSSDVKSSTVVTPLVGLRQAFPDSVVVHSDSDATLAADADLVVVVVGYTKLDEGEYIDNAGTADLARTLFPPADHPELGTAAPLPPLGDRHASPALGGPGDGGDGSGMSRGGDRRSLRLSPHDEALVESAVRANPATVVVVQAGSAVVMPWAHEPAAVIIGWYAGVEGGNALADVICGRAEPGGRLPFVIPHDDADLPPFDRDATSVTYDLLHGQWYLDRHGTVAHFPFGHGLGYTDVALVAARWSGDDAVEVDVSNTGARAGSTVVFVHASLPAASVERPPQRLVGFIRVSVEAGQTVTGRVVIDWSMLDVRRDGGWWTEPGRYLLTVGRSAHDADAIELERVRG